MHSTPLLLDSYRVDQIERDLTVYANVCRSGGSHEDGQNRLACLGACTLHCRGYQRYALSAPVDLDPACTAHVRKVMPGLIALAHTGRAMVSLRDLGNTLTLLSALARNDCLADCLSSRDGSYGLAQCMLSAISFYETEMLTPTVATVRGFAEFTTLAETVKPDLLGTLNAWLEPAERWTDLPSVRCVGEALFGVAWWAFRVPDPETVAFLVHSESPEFVAGKVFWDKQQSLCELPACLTA